MQKLPVFYEVRHFVFCIHRHSIFDSKYVGICPLRNIYDYLNAILPLSHIHVSKQKNILCPDCRLFPDVCDQKDSDNNLTVLYTGYRNNFSSEVAIHGTSVACFFLGLFGLIS